MKNLKFFWGKVRKVRGKMRKREESYEKKRKREESYEKVRKFR